MSNTFKNIVFIILSVACLISIILTGISQYVIADTFESLSAEAARAQQVAIAQEYATEIAQIATMEASRAHALDEQGLALTEQYFGVLEQQQSLRDQVEMYEISDKLSCSYIGQLIQVLQDNKIPIPTPDLKDRLIECVLPNPKGEITMEVLDGEGNIIQKQQVYPRDK